MRTTSAWASRTAIRGPHAGPSIGSLLADYRSGRSTPQEICARVLTGIVERGDDGVWISVASEADVRARCAALDGFDPNALPLFGIPFAVKDSIDVAGWSTTLGCPEYTYPAVSTAPVVSRLLDAGAVLIGKTNLDQFATGLNGTRSAYGIPHSVYGDDLISGGSSSGSALAVALGEVAFAVATDTAGSGRVPAALNGVPGFKPSRGLISTIGLVPACRSLDCISLMARTVDELALLLDLTAAPDRRDPWHRTRRRRTVDLAHVRVGLPPFTDLEFFDDHGMARAHHDARDEIEQSFTTTAVPLAPFLDTGTLLYQGPWVAERLVEFGSFLDEHPDAMHPVVANIIRGGARFDALDVFRAQYRLAELRAEVAELFAAVDVVIVPTIGTTFTIDQVLADPIDTNTRLGHYTHCGNLLDLCAAAVPAGTTTDGRPASCMVLGPALADDVVLAVAARLADQLIPPPLDSEGAMA
jgi:allophanate hydrolase